MPCGRFPSLKFLFPPQLKHAAAARYGESRQPGALMALPSTKVAKSRESQKGYKLGSGHPYPPHSRRPPDGVVKLAIRHSDRQSDRNSDESKFTGRRLDPETGLY